MNSKQTILPILALVASIAIITIPSALAEEDTQRDQITAEVAEHSILIAALIADNETLEQSISDREDVNADFEYALHTYQEKVDIKSAQLANMYANLEAFPDERSEDEQRLYDGLVNSIDVAEGFLASAQAVVDMCISTTASNDAIILSAETQISQNTEMIVDLQERIAYLHSVNRT